MEAVAAGREGTAEIVRLALNRAGIGGYVRPRHDLRHSSITNAAAGMRRADDAGRALVVHEDVTPVSNGRARPAGEAAGH